MYSLVNSRPGNASSRLPSADMQITCQLDMLHKAWCGGTSAKPAVGTPAVPSVYCCKGMHTDTAACHSRCFLCLQTSMGALQRPSTAMILHMHAREPVKTLQLLEQASAAAATIIMSGRRIKQPACLCQHAQSQTQTR
jgi:hypothetical protein